MQRKLTTLITLVLMMALAVSTVFASGNEWVTVPYTDSSVEYGGFWRVVNNPDAIAGSELMGSRTLNTFVEFTFTGSGVRWLGTRSPAMGYATVYLNDILVTSQVDGFGPDNRNQQVILSITGLPESTYTLKIVPEEAKSAAAAMNFVSVDGFQYIPSLDGAIALAEKSIDRPIGGFELGDSIGQFYPVDEVNNLEVALANGRSLLDSNDVEAKLEAISQINIAADGMLAAKQTVVFPDDSGNGRTAVIEGGPVWISGPVGKGLAFNGKGDAVRVEDISISETSSIELWLQMPIAVEGGWQNILGVRGANTDRSPGLWQQGDGDTQTLHLSTLPNWTGFNHMGPDGEGTFFDPEKWYHVALVKDGADYTLYINAEHIITVETGEGMTPGEYLLLGGRNVNVDDLRVWERVRTQAEIAADYQNALSGDEEGLVGYWTFDEVK